ncbi:hypothetical protein [uncultured Oscillibacter sp.]|uniref:hypothetical protein n=1 Tax=uncultured Oscillibacter sp. TaxID=876091 RepID=UPI00262435A0|nr:hypothetical protein [uncultured Oscillibacter sp.]
MTNRGKNFPVFGPFFTKPQKRYPNFIKNSTKYGEKENNLEMRLQSAGRVVIMGLTR